MSGESKLRISVESSSSQNEASLSLKASDPVSMVIFGASGDLSRRKLIPALFRLYRQDLLPKVFRIVGFSRTKMSDQVYRDAMCEALHEQDLGSIEELQQSVFVQSLFYVAGSSLENQAIERLKNRLGELDTLNGMTGNRLYYLSVAPSLFTPIIENLSTAEMIYRKQVKLWSRVVIEKPFGKDLKSAQEMNQIITAILDEEQIYRIDHYLGKETVQNILMFRFGNSIFEPLFNQKYIDHIQITVAETLGMEGRRGAYYDNAGALRDMVQNHLMQLLCLIAMEPPSSLEGNAIRDEKVKVLRSISPMSVDEVAQNTIRGHYDSGEEEGEKTRAYLEEEGVAQESFTETYVALRLSIDNWRWSGVPFLLRTGKRLKKRVSEIAIFFKEPPLQFFREDLNLNTCLLDGHLRSNTLIFSIQPDEGIRLTFACKRPGMLTELAQVNMDFAYKEEFSERSPEAYERLLLDALRGDASLFTRSDEVEYAWRLISSIHEGWKALPKDSLVSYEPFSDGPKQAGRLVDGVSSRWRSLKNM